MSDVPNRIPRSRQREAPRGAYRWIGQSMKRVEDPRLLTGHGTYADDIHLPGMAHAAVLRSPHAHARIKSIDTSRAKALPGVILVMTGAEAAEKSGPLPCFANPPVKQMCIAVDRVRHVGEPVAAVVAESRYLAEDALELIEVTWEPLPVMADPEEAARGTGDGVLHPDRGDTNIAFRRSFDFGPVDEDFAQADHIVRRKLRWAAVRRAADGDGRCRGRIQPRHRQVHDPRQYLDVQLCRLACRGEPRRPGP